MSPPDLNFSTGYIGRGSPPVEAGEFSPAPEPGWVPKSSWDCEDFPPGFPFWGLMLPMLFGVLGWVPVVNLVQAGHGGWALVLVATNCASIVWLILTEKELLPWQRKDRPQRRKSGRRAAREAKPEWYPYPLDIWLRAKKEVQSWVDGYWRP